MVINGCLLRFLNVVSENINNNLKIKKNKKKLNDKKT